MTQRRLFAIATPICAAALLAVATTRPLRAADDVLQRSRAVYAELQSYSDTGTVVNEYGTDSTDRHTFTTRFNRAPRRFYLEFNKEGGDRFVIWGDPDAYHTWWKTTGQQYDYPNPNNAPALSLSGRNTGGASSKIPTLLYAKAALLSDFSNFTDPVLDGNEAVSGHPCYRIAGTTRDVYQATGKEVNVRKLTVWIDTQSLLIRKVLEETKALPGQRSRLITTYEPQANPALDEAKFKFLPPVQQ